jgi:putative transcriptional regulator
MNKTDIIQKVSRLIIAARIEKGWSQSDLAKACLKNRQAIAKWESGTVNIGIYTLYEMAEAMGVPLSMLTAIDTLITESDATATETGGQTKT